MLSQRNTYDKSDCPTSDCQKVTEDVQRIPENQINKKAKDKKVYHCKDKHKNLFFHKTSPLHIQSQFPAF